MELTPHNYFTPEADAEYMSVSQFKRWMECPAAAKAQYVDKVYTPETTDAMKLGTYFHGLFDGTAEKFLMETPELLTLKGAKTAPIKQLDEIYARVQQDEFFMNAVSGERERIFTAELFGMKWKCKVDVVDFDKSFFSDIKTVKDFSPVWDDARKAKVEFYQAARYDLQLAAYQEIIRLSTGYKLDPFLPCVTKEKIPDYEVYEFSGKEIEEYFTAILSGVSDAAVVLKDIKAGIKTAYRCEHCEYCKQTKKLTNTKKARIL